MKRLFFINFCLIFVLAFHISAFAKAHSGQADSLAAPISRTLLFSSGDMGSKFWRIPAIASTPDGFVIAAADKRNDSNKDLPSPIDIVIRRSTDSGSTWGPHQMVLKADSIGGYGDAAIGVHRPSGDVVLVCVHGNGIWESTVDNHSHIVVTRSADNGKTWSAPVDITTQLFDPVEGVAPVKAYAGFASSGTLLCDSRGRLWFVLVTRPGEQKWGPLNCHVCYSDDGGFNWTILPTPVDTNGDEAKIAQLADGSFLISIRNRDRGARKFSRSKDRGKTWSLVTLQPGLIDPACNGDMLSLSFKEAKDLGLAIVDDYGLLIHSIANDPAQRRNVSVFYSRDYGETWTKRNVITPLGSAYSALTVLPDGNLGVLSEENSADEPFDIWFTKVKIDY